MIYKTVKFNKINMIEADNESGLKILVSPVGASIRSITFNGVQMLDVPKNDIDFFSKESTLGKTLGPILNDNLNYEIAGKSYSFNKDYSLNNVLFVGTPFLDKKLFSMTYSYNKKNMKDGLPGNIKYYISYSMATGRNEILVDYRAMTDRPTPINISSDIKFILGNENLKDLFVTLPDSRKKQLEEIILNNIDLYGSKKPIIIEDSKFKLEIETDYDCLIESRFSDCLNIKSIIDKGTIYHHQTLYKFSKNNIY